MLIFLHTAWHQSQHSVVFDINNTSITNISVVESESESLSFCSFSMIFVSIHLQLPTLVPTLQILSFSLLLHICHFIFCFHNALESFLSSISSLPWSNFETIPSLVWITKVASRVVHSVWSCINSPPFTLLLEDFFVFCHPPKAQVCLSLPFSKNFHTPPPSAIG